MTHWHPLPDQIFRYVEQTPGTVLLHSSRVGQSLFSRFFTSPLQIVEVRELEELPALFSKIENAVAHGCFAAGYFTYECAQFFEPRANVRRRRDSDLLAWIAIYERCSTFNHQLGTFNPEPAISGALSDGRECQQASPSSILEFGLDEQGFRASVEQIHDWIRAGDIYQLNFTFPLHTQTEEAPSDLYARLAAAQPVDYGAFLHTKPGRHILSFSPELFFRISKDRRITAEPMKGTAPRGRTTREDMAVAEWLAQDTKNRAENVMIVDLIRNDLGRICTFGSIEVEKLFEVTRYPSLWQMTSRIWGTLRNGVNYQDIFRALFPCGSITGAPKVRAMQLLSQFESQPRGVYTGAIGFFSREETIFNVAIRTLELENGNAMGGVGSGIVIDSDPAAEYRECQLKAEFLTAVSTPFSLIETMLWNGDFPLLELHLIRLADSAHYFGFKCDAEAIRTVLLTLGSYFPDKQARKLRLLLHENGETQCEAELLPPASTTDPLRVCLSPNRTNPADPFLFHKTTRRDLYNRAYAAASSSGFADTIFFNTREEVTEGSVNNVFIETSGRWYTPPLDCGVLPGVYRAHLLASRPDTEEKILTLNDLKAADSVYLCNAVRGLRRVTIDFEGILSF